MKEPDPLALLAEASAHGPPSPTDPQLWAGLRLLAIAGLRRGHANQATQYLQFVQAQRGRDVATLARAELRTVALGGESLSQRRQKTDRTPRPFF